MVTKKKYLKKYPEWICLECVSDNSPFINTSTWHEDKCDVCGKIRAITQPRDFGYPTFKGFEKP